MRPVPSLLDRLAAKDPATERHARRVALLVVQVGAELELPPERLRALVLGALVHDVGKLSIPDELLQKPGSLDAGEYAAVQAHTDLGYELLGELGGFRDEVRGLVRDHHERLDGTGYPRGLAGDDLSLDTRILTVCDVYDALRSRRVYRDAWTHAQAMELLWSEAGAAYDSLCVEALARVVERLQDGRCPAVRPAMALAAAY